MIGTILEMEGLIIRAEAAVNKAANVIEDVKKGYFSTEDARLLYAYKPNAETKCDIVQDYIGETSQLVSELYNCFRELHNEPRSHSKTTEIRTV